MQFLTGALKTFACRLKKAVLLSFLDPIETPSCRGMSSVLHGKNCRVCRSGFSRMPLLKRCSVSALVRDNGDCIEMSTFRSGNRPSPLESERDFSPDA